MNNINEKFVAMYLPETTNNITPSRRGFISADAAWNYVYTQMCDKCQYERTLAIDAINKNKLTKEYLDFCIEHDGWEPQKTPACALEWFVGSESEFTTEELQKIAELGKLNNGS
jgi:hypothetical protein